jgi:hypothetical protein
MEFLEEEQLVIRRYLLGDLDEERRQQVEERLFTSPAFKTQLQIAEDELVEDYLAGRLSASARDVFRRRFLLIREQKQRIELISALRAYADKQPPLSIPAAASGSRTRYYGGSRLPVFLAGSPSRSMLTAAVIIVILVGGAMGLLRYLSKTSMNPADLSRRQEIELEVRRLNPPSGQPFPPELATPAAHISSVTLNPNTVTRSGGELAKVEISDSVTIMQFRLKLPLDGYDSYRLTLYTSEGAELLGHDGLTPQSLNGIKDLIFNLPSSALPPGDYQFRLSGRRNANRFEEVADYNLRVAPRNSR